MKLNNILLTGGSGLLGKELHKYIPFTAPSHEEMDICDANTMNKYKDMDTIIHCAAYTDVAKAEKEKRKCYWTNVIGTYNISQVFKDKYIVFISSEYAVNPVNYYSYTKAMAEKIIKANCKNYLIIRTLFKANPFPYEYAFFDQETYGDYVDIIAPMIATAILCQEKGVIQIGTGRKTIFELARRTRPEIKGISVDDIKDVKLPKEAYV